MKRILYSSRLTVLAASRLASTMEDILIISRARNARDAITGFLWSDGFSFTQVIEGPRRPMDALYARIVADPRHHAIKLKIDEPIGARAFPRWSMCGMTLSDLDDNLIGPAEVGHDLYAFSGDVLLALLQKMNDAYGERLDRAHFRLWGI